MRANEDLALSLGINTMRDKVIFLSISTLIAGLSGGLYAAYMGSLMADQASFLGSFEILLNVMIGGCGTLFGPIIGGTLLPLLTETLHFLGSLRLVVYGIILILVMGFLPQGIVGGLNSLFIYLTQRRTGSRLETAVPSSTNEETRK